VPSILTFTLLGNPTREPVRGKGRIVTHRCQDVHGQTHVQRFPLGSVRGIVYLDALCLHCGTHLVWTEEEDPVPDGSSRPSATKAVETA
jgi:hypothetical protein